MRKFTLVLVASATMIVAGCGKKEESQTAVPDAAPAVVEAAPATVAEPAVAAAPANEVGEKLYKGTCSMCHATGAAGAPIKGNKADWAPRIAQGNELLYTHALTGYTGAKGVMPPKGGMASLKDEDVKAAVDYMVSQSQ